jgi:hypothetical protein
MTIFHARNPLTLIEVMNDEIEHDLDEEGMRVFNFLDGSLRSSPGIDTPLAEVSAAVEVFGTGFEPTDDELQGALYALKYRIDEGVVKDCEII